MGSSATKHHVSIRETTQFGAVLHGADVSDLDELKQVLHGYGASEVALEYTLPTDERRSHSSSIAVNNLSQEDFDWLIEDAQYEYRYVAFG
jgi:hypothetical protein